MVDAATLRAHRAARQGLDGTLTGADPAAVVDRVGWTRSVGGSTPSLTLSSRAGGSLTDLLHQGIVDQRRLVGLWDYDPGTDDVIWAPDTRLDAAQRDATQEAVAAPRNDVQAGLGDNRGLSLDSPPSRVGRLTALRHHGDR